MLHPPAARGILAPQRGVDAALVLGGTTLDHGPVGLSDPTTLEQSAKLRQSLAVAAEHQAPRGIAVQAVCQRRRARQPEPQRAEMILQAFAAPRSFGALVDRESGRLVDDEHQGVAIKHSRYHLFRGHDETAITGARMNDSAVEQQNWWQRVRGGLKRTSASVGGAITDLVAKRKLDQGMLDEIEEVLIRADLGVDCAARIAAAVGEGRYDKAITADEVKQVLSGEVEKVLAPVAEPLAIGHEKPFVVLVVGVNGSGKTTTIGKLAAKARAQGYSVMLAAGDTFRAAAIDQLKIWGARAGASVLARSPGADPAGLAFDALTEARGKIDLLLIDTAGRLQNKAVLMDELEKVVRVIKKVDRSAPHAVLLVLDASVGQNALSQVEIFRDVAGVTGLVMTKLDSTARGGILVAIAGKYGLPVHYIGVGEGLDDLAPFSAKEFADAIAGIA